MSWQEALRRIDGDLAAGKLSKEQYALRREELLAHASSTPTATAQQAPITLKIPPDVPVAARPSVPAKDLLTTDRQTTAPSPADERSTDSMPHPRRATQVTVAEAVRPQDLPPPVPPQTTPRPTRPRPPEPARHEPPPVNRHRGSAPTVAFLVTGVVLVLALIGGGLWWLTSDDDTRNAAQPPPSATTTAASEFAMMDRLPELPGALHLDSGTVPVTDVADLYGAEEAAALRRNGVREATWKASARQADGIETSYVILIAHAPAQPTASKAAGSLQQVGRKYAESVKPIDGLRTFRLQTGNSRLYFAVYHSDRFAVHVSVHEAPRGQERETRAKLKELLRSVTETLVPDK
ncbi:MAG: hypothetical protein ACRDQF_09155 [Thermocrispum sp.]